MNAARKNRKPAVALVTEAELVTILANAEAANDPYAINAVHRARRGDVGYQMACAMILGR